MKIHYYFDVGKLQTAKNEYEQKPAENAQNARLEIGLISIKRVMGNVYSTLSSYILCIVF